MNTPTGQLYEFGEFRLEPAERLLSRNGKPVTLTPKAFETLVVLIQKSGRLVDKNELIQTVWAGTFVEEANLARNIWTLRKALGDDDTIHRYIETVPKRGYRFVAPVRCVVEAPVEEETILTQRRLRARIVREEVETTDEPQSESQVYQPNAESTGTLAAQDRLTARRVVGRRVAVFAVLTLTVVTGAFGVRFWTKHAVASRTRIGSVAVLPLRSLTAGENNDALGLGLTDALITKLGSLRMVTVRPTSAVVKFVKSDLDGLEIGKRLQTDAVLEGTIQQSDGRIRITARLLNVASGEQIWAEKFDEPANELFALQDALSNKITETLAFELKKEEIEQLASRPTTSSEAYERYLRGRFYQTQNNEQGLTRSIECYEQAIGLDPNFADAYAGLADANVLLYNFGFRSPGEVLPRAQQFIDRALKLNPNLPEAYNSLALVQFFFERDWKAAERSLQKAIALDPHNSTAFLRYGYFLIQMGSFDEALSKLERARELNPLSPMVQADIGLAYLCARRYPQAIEQLERVTAENPEFALAHWFLGAAYEEDGDMDKSFASELRALAAEGGGELASRLLKVKERAGLSAANQLWLDELLRTRRKTSVPALSIASRYATLKNREQTLAWLEKAVEEGDETLSQIKYLTRYDFTRGDQRFQLILKRISIS